MLHKHALEGFQCKSGVMPPRGGRPDLADQSIFNAEYGSGTLYDWSGTQRSAAEQMFQLYENVTALQFVEVTDYAWTWAR